MSKSKLLKRKITLHLLWLHAMRSYLRLALFFYYKKIEINYTAPLKENQARLFLGNHQNGLMDPLLIATKKGQFSYFLTRASVFKKEWIATFLKSLLMIPVYRVRDGWDQISKNEAVFKTCSELLHDGHAIVLFPEGNHNIKRYVRPLSKGFTRIVEATLKHYPGDDIALVPVGLNYKNAEAFGDSVVLNFGNPLDSKAYGELSEGPSVLKMKQDVFHALTQLTTHVDVENYKDTLEELERLNCDFLDPEAVNGCLANQFKTCKAQPEKTTGFIKVIAKLGLIIGLCVPYGIWKLLIEPKVKEPEFTATFRFAAVISLVPVFMLIIALVIGFNYGILYAFLYLISVFILDILAVKL